MTDRTCRECRELISAFIDGAATQEENTRLRQHLATCAECRATLDSYRVIGGAIRSMPAVHAPHHLTESIYAQTIDAEPRRLFLITSRLGYSLAAVASVLVIFVVAAYLIIGGYQRGIDPVVDSSEPKTNQVWELQKAIQISFNKEMNRESVVAALGMQPSGEKDRLAMRWEGNTLIIGGNTTLKPGAAYEIKISTDATDAYGNQLKEPFQLAFSTQSTIATVQTPTPQPTPSASPTVVSSATANSTRLTPTTEVEATEPSVDAPVAPSETNESPTSPGSGNATPTSDIIPVEPVEPVDPAVPTQEPTPRPSATPTPTEPIRVVDPTATSTPPPPATPTPVPPMPTSPPTATVVPPTPTLMPTATPDSIPVIGAIGDVYWRDQTVRDRLGDPLASQSSIVTDQLDFQRGVMILNGDTARIYVLKSGSGWDSFGLPSGDYPESSDGPDAGIYVPGGAFGALWQQDQAVQDELGYALTRYANGFISEIQHFNGGTIVATPSTLYILYSDNTWDWFTRS